MSEKKYIFAIDHGTSAVKVAIADTCGEVLAWDWEDTDIYLSSGGAAVGLPFKTTRSATLPGVTDPLAIS